MLPVKGMVEKISCVDSDALYVSVSQCVQIVFRLIKFNLCLSLRKLGLAILVEDSLTSCILRKVNKLLTLIPFDFKSICFGQ